MIETGRQGQADQIMRNPPTPRGVPAEWGMRAEGEYPPASAKRVSPGFGTRATEDTERSASRCARQIGQRRPWRPVCAS